MLRILLPICAALISILFSLQVLAQGPQLSFFYEDATNLPNAECFIYQEKNNQQKISFFPLINEKTNAPMGIRNYTMDVEVNAGIVFIANGVSSANYNCYEKVDVKNKIVLFYDDFPDSLNAADTIASLQEKIRMAIDKKALAAVVISYHDSAPMFVLNTDDELPAISVNHSAAGRIFAMAGMDAAKMEESWQRGSIPESKVLSVSMHLHIDGRFADMESKNFSYHYPAAFIPETEIDQQKRINEKALAFLLDLFGELNPQWSRERIYYYPGYTSKIFYTAYWGKAFSCETGVYHVFPEESYSFAQAVHENTHSLFRKNQMTFSSFIDEGIAMYAEAMATDREINNRKTYTFLQQDKLFPLEKMLETTIGEQKEYSDIAYSASGSFIDFIIDEYGLQTIPALSIKPLPGVLKTDIQKIEQKWHTWLTRTNETMKQ